jgi:rare lipoprotein A (peptidoglycan hydrolase)
VTVTRAVWLAPAFPGSRSHNHGMLRLQRAHWPAAATAAALLLGAALEIGCGASTPAAKRGSTASAPANAGVPATATSPGMAAPRSPLSSTAAAPSTSATRTTASPSRGPVAPAHPVPAAFRPAPGAPSDAEVRSELAQMASIQRSEREQALSAAAANLAGLLPWSLEPRSGVQVSVASVFTDYGLGLACGGLLGREQLGVAHKTAPCGTLITFTYAGRSLTVPVIDRGPYIAGREWDLTGATAAALGFPGLGRIEWSLAR